ncbi:hypothetical protein CWI38_1444p0010 [Hamiltosporidium tvaerminnensis]|uniref:Uncharacterized protein n=1 Tax=Hamiltosporidium tvaerminnensis TaxID=1176355 RepID=A0A4Q9LR68_9MICR|nr:hypothetical protein CWI38_1444p0010 [Hamiltosporidium tvaerminnensis]
MVDCGVFKIGFALKGCGFLNLKPKNNTPLISQGGTTLEEPTININEELDLEEETVLVKEVEENI